MSDGFDRVDRWVAKDGPERGSAVFWNRSGMGNCEVISSRRRFNAGSIIVLFGWPELMKLTMAKARSMAAGFTKIVAGIVESSFH